MGRTLEEIIKGQLIAGIEASKSKPDEITAIELELGGAEEAE